MAWNYYRIQLIPQHRSSGERLPVIRVPIIDTIAEALAGTSDISDIRIWACRALERFLQYHPPEGHPGPSLAEAILRNDALQYSLWFINYSETLARLLDELKSLLSKRKFGTKGIGIQQAIDEYVEVHFDTWLLWPEHTLTFSMIFFSVLVFKRDRKGYPSSLTQSWPQEGTRGQTPQAQASLLRC